MIISLVCNINNITEENLHLSADWEVGGWEDGD